MTEKRYNISDLFPMAAVVFLFLLVYFRAIQLPGLTSVHPDTSDLYYRNQSMFLGYLDLFRSKGIGDLFNKLRLFYDHSMLNMHGPLSFTMRNIYTFIIGDRLPLTPSVMLFEKVVVASLAGVYFYLFGKKFISGRFGVIFSASFAVAPWLGIALRFSENYSLYVILTEIATLYYYTDFINNPENKRAALMAPLSLAVYLITGLDWPMFVPLVLFYAFLNKKTKEVLSNKYNLIPVLVLSLHVIFASWLFLSDRISGVSVYGLGRWKWVFAGYPFNKILMKFGNLELTHKGSLPELLRYLFHAYGFGWYIATSVAVVSIFRAIREKKIFSPAWQDNFVLFSSCWLVIMSLPFIKSGADHLTYAFTLSIPTIFLLSSVLMKIKLRGVIIFTLATMLLQWCVFFNCFGKYLSDPTILHGDDYRIQYIHDDDKRVLAASYFIIEKHPELLTKGNVSLMPYMLVCYPGNPAFVGDYARGLYERIKPWAFEPFENNMPRQVYYYINARNFNHGRDIVDYIDWVVLSSELVKPQWGNISADYYARLLSDPRINWLGNFRDAGGREFWVGQINPKNTPKNKTIGEAPVFDVNNLASEYEKRYDRQSYLRQGLEVNIAAW